MKNENMYYVLAHPNPLEPFKPKSTRVSSLKTNIPHLLRSQEQVFKRQLRECPAPSSVPYEYKPHVKKIPLIERPPPKGRKRIIHNHEEKRYKRILLGKNITNSDERLRGIKVPKVISQSFEYTVEDVMGRKGRSVSGYFYGGRWTRGYIEYTPGFFEKGELIPGSSNILRKKCKALKNYSFLDTIDISKKVLDSQKLWRNKSMKELSFRDINYVKNLENIEKEMMKFSARS